jgi:predicted nucleic acid-binding protein
MIKILLDTNVVLDIALQRPHFYNDAANIFKKICEKKIQAFVSASTITDIFYILQKENNKEKASQFLLRLIQVIDIVGIDREIILDALALGWNDFEDAVQNCVAQRNGIDIIVTRNVKDYEQSKMKIFSPADFLKNI